MAKNKVYQFGATITLAEVIIKILEPYSPKIALYVLDVARASIEPKAKRSKKK